MKWSELKSRERDCLIAEKVMGWGKDYLNVDWSPSTDIKAALSLVDLCFHEFEIHNFKAGRKKKLWMKLLKEVRPYWTVYFRSVKKHSRSDTEYGDTPAEAICLAALRAVGVEIET
jgi:hypothetical protein